MIELRWAVDNSLNGFKILQYRCLHGQEIFGMPLGGVWGEWKNVLEVDITTIESNGSGTHEPERQAP